MATFPGGVLSATVPAPTSVRYPPTGPAELFSLLYAEIVAMETALLGGSQISFASGVIALTGQTSENIVAASGASQTLPAPSVHIGSDITLSASCTIGMPTPTRGAYCYARVRQAAGGGYTVTFTGVKWPGGTAPTMSSADNAIDLYEFQADGTYWYGVTAGQAFA